VVHGGGRARRIIDTVGIVRPESGINTDGKWAIVVETSNHGVLIVIDPGPLAEVILDLALVELASLINTDIRIVVLADHTNADSISESIGHETTIAALITDLLGGARIDHAILLAIDKLLLRDDRELLVGNKPGTLHAASGREGPAGTTVGLILNVGNSTVLTPILGVRIVTTTAVGESHTTRKLVDGESTEVLGSELFLSKIGKLVKSEHTLALTVKVTNKSVVALESIVAGNVLLSTVVDLTILDGPVNELIINVESESAGGENSKSNKDSLHCFFFSTFLIVLSIFIWFYL